MRTTRALFVLSVTAAAGLAWAHGGNPQQGRGAQGVGRYQLAKYWVGKEIRVLDRQSGRLFSLDPKRNEALLIDPLSGNSVSKPLERTEVRPVGGVPAPAWPTRDAGSGSLRFIGLGEHDPRAGTIEAGATPALFDADTGRIYKVLSPTEIEVIDPVEARVTRRHLRLRDGTKLSARMVHTRNEHQAVSGLQALHQAQLQFRTQDPDQDGTDYGTLEELGAAKLIPESLAKGVHFGYRFTLQVDPRANVWLAVASPTEAGKTGVRHFAISERGVPYESPKPIPLNDECRIPRTAKRVSR